MTPITRLCLGATLATYLALFVGEALLWRQPLLQAVVTPKLNPGLGVDIAVQGQVLRALFANQGAYNLALALGGLAGWRMVARGRGDAGLALVRFVCVVGIGAGLVLAATTEVYGGAAAQVVFPALALAGLRQRPA